MKILFISENYPPFVKGGAEISTSLLAEQLARDNEVVVACTKIAPAPWRQGGVLAYPILERASIGTKNIGSALRYAIGITFGPVVSSLRLLRLIRKFKPDVVNVVVTLYPFIPLILIVRFVYRCPIFIDCRDYSLICPIHFKNNELEDPKRSSHGYRCLLRGYQIDRPFLRVLATPFAVYESIVFNIYKSLLRFSIDRFEGIILVPLSRYVQDQLILNGYRADKTIVIHNISRKRDDLSHLPKFLTPTFAYAGRIEKEKGVWDLVAATELLGTLTEKPFEVQIAGAGTDYRELLHYLEKHPSLPIRLMGKIEPSDVLPLYKRSLAIIAPSRWPEPFGRFIQESISTATPVIATAAGGITEAVDNGVTGLLFGVGDISALANAMKRLLENPDEAEKIGIAMSALREEYGADAIGTKRMNLYRGIADRPLRILNVISMGHPHGGSSISVLLLKEELEKRGEDVRVFSSNLRGDDMFNDYELPVIPKGSLLKALHHLFYVKAYFMMKSVMNDFRPDIVHFHNVDAFSPSVFFAIGRTPAVMTIHGPEEFTRKLLPWVLLSEDFKKTPFDLHDLTLTGHWRYFYYRYVQWPAYQFAFRHIKKFIVASHFMEEAVSNDIPAQKIVRIPYGIRLPLPAPLPPRLRILFVGRLVAVKGVDTLIRAFAEVAKKMPEVDLRIVGDGPLRTDLEALAKDLHLGSKVEFAGWIPNGSATIREYEQASLVAIPSVWPEAFGIVCIEALAVGRPVVAAHAGALPELITEGKTGMIVPPEDPAGMARAMLTILQDPQTLQHMSAAAAKQASHFSEILFTDRTASLYKDILSEDSSERKRMP